MFKILFVCHGNICRSPLAKYLSRKIIREMHRENDFFVESRATSTEELGNPVYPPMYRTMTQHGIDCDGHASIQLKKSDYDAYDMILCMDDRNMRNMMRMFGSDPQHKCALLTDYAKTFSGEIEDPWYTGHFELVYQEVKECCENLLASL